MKWLLFSLFFMGPFWGKFVWSDWQIPHSQPQQMRFHNSTFPKCHISSDLCFVKLSMFPTTSCILSKKLHTLHFYTCGKKKAPNIYFSQRKRIKYSSMMPNNVLRYSSLNSKLGYVVEGTEVEKRHESGCTNVITIQY